ncbi:hypothetical protein [Clostridium sp. JN-9]|uniref:hypothetical protein n=1 Tax=Clostridium sp. JN-9 TaxID=2507159 RepID=UPI0013E8CBD0|nr:hypothetical protein [Clostridium sp. JN-9]
MKRKFIVFSIVTIAIFSLLLGSMAKNNNQIIKKYCIEDKEPIAVISGIKIYRNRF